jgi:putative salt-induced outer membrane protein YdiY
MVDTDTRRTPEDPFGSAVRRAFDWTDLRGPLLFLAILAGALVAYGATGAVEEEGEPEKPPSPWTNSTELSLVLTEGNADAMTIGFKETLEYKAKKGNTRLKVDTLRADTSDDPYLLVEPGEVPTNFATIAVRPGAEPDVERYFIEGRYEGNLPKKATWNSGASWDRNLDAGILSRYIVFGGLGHTWRDSEDLTFRTSYGLSYTDRHEEIQDPEREEEFAGVRLTLDYKDKWGATTTYDNDFTFNISVKDYQDFNIDWTQGVSVSMGKHLALKVSLQFLYAGEPALEEVDVIARVILVDPDGIPGNGDEFFETVETGGIEITAGEDVLRKEPLDTTFRTSLQITF